MNTVAADLLWIRQCWPLLDELLDTRHHGHVWPPAGRIVEHLAHTRDQPAERPARDGSGAGETQAPIRLEIVDTAVAIERDLLELCDRAALLEPASVPRQERWRYNSSWPYGTPWACVWLSGALDWLPAAWLYRVASTVRACRRQLDTALDQARQTRRLAEKCPHCRGALDLHGGDGAQPAVTCRACQRTWRMTEPDPAAA